MKYEIWLRPNRRPGVALMVLAGIVGGTALVLTVTAGWREATSGRILGATGVAVCVGAMIVFVLGWRSATQPRISRQAGHVWFRIGRQGPIAVPLEVIEAFFLGQGEARLPAGLGEGLESVNLVARLSQRRTDWLHREVNPRLASWCDGYITIRGTCCEPLQVDVIHRLNRQLSLAKRNTHEA